MFGNGSKVVFDNDVHIIYPRRKIRDTCSGRKLGAIKVENGIVHFNFPLVRIRCQTL